MQSPLDARFGRAKYFILLDTETGASSSLDNSVNLNAVQGAGIQAAKKVVDLEAEAVITGHVGPKAFAALRAGGVRIYTGASGTVADAIAQFNSGKLTEAVSASVEGHW